MNDKRVILTVRATQDGYYANYYYKGPITSDEGYFPGEVFQVDATPYACKDEKGKPVYELDGDGSKIPILDKKGNHVLDERGKKSFKIKMATFFAPEWMDRVPDDTPLTYPDRPKWQIPEVYRIKKQKISDPQAVPLDVLQAAGMSVPRSVSGVLEPEPAAQEVI